MSIDARSSASRITLQCAIMKRWRSFSKILTQKDPRSLCATVSRRLMAAGVYAVRSINTRLWECQGQRVVGYKVGLSVKAVQTQWA